MPSHPRLDPAELPEDSWDTHIHIFDPVRHPYEPDSPYIPPPCSVEQLLDAFPCSNFCIVMAMPEGTRPELALESVAKISSLPGRTARATIVLDFDRVPDEQLQQLHTKGVRSIRIHTKGAITKGLSGDEALREYIVKVAERIAPLGWSLDGQLRTAQWVTLAPTIIELHGRLGITFVADHCFYLKPEDYGTPAWETCLSLVDRGIVYVKISGLDRLVKDNDLAATKDTVIGLTTAHNGERCLFGSDWPHVVGQTTHFGEGLMPIDSLFELGYHKQWLSPETFANLLVHNPRRLYL